MLLKHTRFWFYNTLAFTLLKLPAMVSDLLQVCCGFCSVTRVLFVSVLFISQNCTHSSSVIYKAAKQI
ncbi:hypothetical protein QVD17_08528 [Tagetes erecta]|uniref:Uncharacterized protein n=1 Tax=Tagetes erecta TaxID=13708 RepID=A0AAD8KZ57_TARER|nr:hypothetical protein QVD17_08528 [Tagetes erecta]